MNLPAIATAAENPVAGSQFLLPPHLEPLSERPVVIFPGPVHLHVAPPLQWVRDLGRLVAYLGLFALLTWCEVCVQTVARRIIRIIA